MLLTFGTAQGFSQYIPEWAGGFGGDREDRGKAVIQAPNGDFIITGEVSHRRTNMWLIRLTTSGGEIWGKTYENNFSSSGLAVAHTPNNKIVVAGEYIKSWRKQDINGFLMMTDSTGEPEWTHEYGNKLSDKFNDMILSSSGEIVAVGYSQEADYGEKEIWFVRTDTTGKILAEARYGDFEEDVANVVIESLDGNFIIGGYANLNGIKVLRIMKVSPEGETLWDMPYTIDKIKEVQDLVQTADGSIYACGQYRMMPLTDYNHLLVKVSDAGDLLYMKTYGNYNWEESTSITVTHDNHLVMGGFEKSEDELYADYKILKTDTAGNLLFQHRFSKHSLDFANEILETQDKGLLLVGSTYHNENGWDYAALKYKYLKRTEANFITPETSVSTISALSFMVKICINGYAPPQRAEIIRNGDIIAEDIYLPSAIPENKCLYPVYIEVPLVLGKNVLTVEIEDNTGFISSDEITIYSIPEDNLNR
ncbi:MAG: hypothetical protein U9N85_01760 [Bacteroidota bacterium]|nr:hypothetical protein [Bacteroidota bacterium]